MTLAMDWGLFTRPLLSLRLCAGKHRGDAFGIDIERQEGERLVAGVSPLVNEIERFIDQ